MNEPDETTRLTEAIEDLNNHRFLRIHNSYPRMILYQFTRGLAFGLGSVVGATFLVSMLVWWLSQFEFLPLIGDWIAQIVDQIESTTGGQ